VRADDQEGQAAACRRIVEQGQAQVVALTLADEGALLTTRDGTWRASALPVEPVSGVGAGDSFLGGMTWSLAEGHSVEKAFRYAVAAGSAALLEPGTELLPWCRRQMSISRGCGAKELVTTRQRYCNFRDTTLMVPSPGSSET
jgi:6-phosphofructokinase 2